MPEGKKLKVTKNTDHCRGGLGGVCNDKDVTESVIQNIGNADGAPSPNPNK